VARILVIDDEPRIRSLLQTAIGDAGHEVFEAANGKGAAKFLAQQPVDLVITDLVMPETEGIETIRTLRRQHPDIKIIAISGAFQGRFLDVARALGADATLDKPFSIQKLLETVETVIR